MKSLFLVLSLFSVSAMALTETEKTRLRDVAVKVTYATNTESGGTGTIIRSDASGSTILTNRHVCGVVEEGGLVIKGEDQYKVASYKIYPFHDLCLIKIKKNLGINVNISRHLPVAPEKSFVSGFPMLLPNVITEGHFSDKLRVEILVDVRPCTPKETEQDPMMCMFAGFPVTEQYNSQLTSNLIQPGNSGSGVFNADLELAGVVFAGAGSIGWALIVPEADVLYFLATESLYETKVPKVAPKKKSKENLQAAKKKCLRTVDYPSAQVEGLCKKLKNQEI